MIPSRRGRLSRIALDITPLRRSRDFRLLWTGLFISELGYQFSLIAMFVQVYALTKSSAAVGAVGLVQLVPMVVVSLAKEVSAGAAAGVSGALVLGKSLTPFPKPPAQAQLVRRGIYSIMRHPIYAGLIALSFGWAYLWDSGRGVALALIQAVLLDIKARREERWLREKFPDYDEYAVKVRRLIPWLY